MRKNLYFIFLQFIIFALFLVVCMEYSLIFSYNYKYLFGERRLVENIQLGILSSASLYAVSKIKVNDIFFFWFCLFLFIFFEEINWGQEFFFVHMNFSGCRDFSLHNIESNKMESLFYAILFVFMIFPNQILSVYKKRSLYSRKVLFRYAFPSYLIIISCLLFLIKVSINLSYELEECYEVFLYLVMSKYMIIMSKR